MSNENDLITAAWKAYEDKLNASKNEDYIINRPQMNKLIEAHKFFSKIAKRCDGAIEPFKVIPKEEHGSITVYAHLFDLEGNEATKLGEILSTAHSLTIDSLADGRVCISFLIPNVYTKREDK